MDAPGPTGASASPSARCATSPSQPEPALPTQAPLDAHSILFGTAPPEDSPVPAAARAAQPSPLMLAHEAEAEAQQRQSAPPATQPSAGPGTSAGSPTRAALGAALGESAMPQHTSLQRLHASDQIGRAGTDSPSLPRAPSGQAHYANGLLQLSMYGSIEAEDAVGSKYMQYVVQCCWTPHAAHLQPVSWVVARRFSDFEHLHECLESVRARTGRPATLPPMPAKSLFGGRTSWVVSSRLQSLLEYLRRLLTVWPACLQLNIMDNFLLLTARLAGHTGERLHSSPPAAFTFARNIGSSPRVLDVREMQFAAMLAELLNSGGAISASDGTAPSPTHLAEEAHIAVRCLQLTLDAHFEGVAKLSDVELGNALNTVDELNAWIAAWT